MIIEDDKKNKSAMKNKDIKSIKPNFELKSSHVNNLKENSGVNERAYEYSNWNNKTSNNIYKKLIDIFEKELEEDKKTQIFVTRYEYKDSILKDKLSRANALMIELTNTLTDKQISVTKDGKDNNPGANTCPVTSPVMLSTATLKEEPITIRPAEKREGIFNDVNLTEDYELGLRFFQLGLKTGFFNVKLDGDKNSTRVSTAEFFPNKFWPAVKQRSRWIAGICFQNWKAHKWNGNLVTKYFLFRDRKPIISFWSTFLSNVILLYFIYLAVGTMFKFDNSLISGKIPTALWFLMIFNLVFMVSKSVHRFIFTYNWYGFSYALASIFRLALDSFINFFAIIRSVSVYHKTKKKVVWDATTHY